MRRFLPLLLFAICYLLFALPVAADFDRAYQDYLYQSDQYRLNLTNFLTAKNRYLTYQTLTSQTEALQATKSFLESRDQVLITYLQMLIEKNPPENFKKLLNEEIGFLSDQKDLVPAVGSLSDTVRVSATFEEHYPITLVLSRQTVANVILDKVRALDGRLATMETGFETKINAVKSQGKDVTTLERWLLETKNKQLLAREKISSAQTFTDKLSPSKSSTQISKDYGDIQVLIFEANQYLKEASAYLKEIKEELKYGNY